MVAGSMALALNYGLIVPLFSSVSTTQFKDTGIYTIL